MDGLTKSSNNTTGSSMEGGFIYRDEHGNKIYQQYNGGGMFGLATRDEILGLTAEVRALGKQLVPAPVEETKLYTVEVTKDGERVGTYRDVTRVWDRMEHGGQLEIYRTDGRVVLSGKDYSYSYSLTEQKAEPEVKSIGLYGIGAFQELRKYADELNHRIELLELRLGNKSFGKQAQPAKGAKR